MKSLEDRSALSNNHYDKMRMSGFELGFSQNFFPLIMEKSMSCVSVVSIYSVRLI